jgi:hypothetical protein
MHINTKRVVAVLAVLLISTFSIDSVMTNASAAYTGGKLDLFTQKELYNGKGQNAASDAFSPGTPVEIHALLTYNDYPLSQWLVSFGVVGPPNPYENITLIYTARTDENGLAYISFRIPPTEETTFGQWIVYGNSEITTEVATSDILFFRVGWIVNIVSIKTINQNHVVSTDFTKGSPVGVEIGLRNIAMLEKNVTLALTILDSLELYIDSEELSNIIVPANGTTIYVPFTLNIPKSATLGGATIYTNAHTTPIIMGGVSYCPQRTSSFSIVEHDIAISSVKTSKDIVFIGEAVYIDVIVVNNGQEPESFSVNVYSNETLLGTADINALQSASNITTMFTWDTSLFSEGNYSISAFASPVPGEVDFSDNLFLDGVVQVRSRIHDIAVLNVVPSASLVYEGSDVSLSVLVKNNGNTTESFNLTAYYDSVIINVMFVEDLDFGTQRTLVFNWNTNKVPRGNYTISAHAEPVPGETNTTNNTFTYGTISIVAPPTSYVIPDWFNLALLLLLVLLIVLLILWFVVRRKKKKNEETFYSGWVAWYYCYDPERRLSNTDSLRKNLKEI